MRRTLDAIPLWAALLLCATLGLAPYAPEPHVWEKLRMLAAGDLVRAIDWFDLLMHGLAWILLAAKLVAGVSRRNP